MAIHVRCSCGNMLQAKDEWAGRRAKCPRCGSVVQVPDPQAADPLGDSTLDDLSVDELSQPSAARGESPFAKEPTPTAAKRGWFSWLFWEFPSFGTTMKWNEPIWFPIRLRGDLAQRLVIVLAAWFLGIGVFLALFAVNQNPPGIFLAVGLGLMFLGAAGIVVLGRRPHVAGTIRMTKDMIVRTRQYASLAITQWFETAHWPYSQISRCVIIPANVLGKGFSVMMITIGLDKEIVGVPRKIDLEELKRNLAQQGVVVESGSTVPTEFTSGLDFVAPVVMSVIGTVCLLGGLGFYVFAVGGLRPAEEQANEVWQAQRDRMQEVHEQMRLVPDLVPDRVRPTAPIAAPAAPPVHLGQHAEEATAHDVGSGVPVPHFPGGNMGPGFRGPAGSPFGDAIPSPNDSRLPMGAMNHDPFQVVTPSGAISQSDETPVAGGSGGAPFREVSPDRQLVIGFRYTMGSWAGQDALRFLDPLYDRAAARSSQQSVMAREGYAVGAIRVHAGQFVHAVQVVFMRIAAGERLDVNDTYASDWLGAPPPDPSSDNVVELGGSGARVIGVYGRKVAVLDAVGLVVDQQP